jgi:hypothetical protein
VVLAAQQAVRRAAVLPQEHSVLARVSAQDSVTQRPAWLAQAWVQVRSAALRLLRWSVVARQDSSVPEREQEA